MTDAIRAFAASVASGAWRERPFLLIAVCNRLTKSVTPCWDIGPALSYSEHGIVYANLYQAGSSA